MTLKINWYRFQYVDVSFYILMHISCTDMYTSVKYTKEAYEKSLSHASLRYYTIVMLYWL